MPHLLHLYAYFNRTWFARTNRNLSLSTAVYIHTDTRLMSSNAFYRISMIEAVVSVTGRQLKCIPVDRINIVYISKFLYILNVSLTTDEAVCVPCIHNNILYTQPLCTCERRMRTNASADGIV